MKSSILPGQALKLPISGWDLTTHVVYVQTHSSELSTGAPAAKLHRRLWGYTHTHTPRATHTHTHTLLQLARLPRLGSLNFKKSFCSDSSALKHSGSRGGVSTPKQVAVVVVKHHRVGNSNRIVVQGDSLKDSVS